MQKYPVPPYEYSYGCESCYIASSGKRPCTRNQHEATLTVLLLASSSC